MREVGRLSGRFGERPSGIGIWVTVRCFYDRFELFDLALKTVELEGLNLEFGCGWKAESINYLAEKLDGTVHGFDALEGLPEAWFANQPKGTFGSDRRLPEVRENVALHIGWFKDTLPEFVAKNEGPVAFLHIDCDL